MEIRLRDLLQSFQGMHTEKRYPKNQSKVPVYIRTPHLDWEGDILFSTYQLVCPICGTVVKRSYHFCKECGNNLGGNHEQ